MSGPASSLQLPGPRRILRAIASRLPPRGSIKGAFLGVALSLAALGLAASIWSTVSVWQDNRAISRLSAGEDLLVASGARPQVLLARAHFLLQHGRIDEAQALVPAVKAGGSMQLLATLHYDLANARLRAAYSLLEQNRVDPAIPLVRLAKDGYRAALAINPGDWDARYNLDLAMRLVRDFPQIERSFDDPPPQIPKQLWTDLPGVPKGLP
jgi:mxaK protein